MSLWGRVGEGIGYGLAAVVLGPSAAIQRRARRAMRSSFAELCERRSATKLVAPRFVRRASMRLAKGATSIGLEVELDIVGKHARATASIDPLPSFVQAEASKNLTAIDGLRRRRGPPLAMHDGLRIDSGSIDAALADELVRAIGATLLGALEAIQVIVGGDRIDVNVVAPTTFAEWNAIADGLLAFATWLSERWPSSYRG